MARDFDGVTDRIDYGSVQVTQGQAQTFSCWLKLDTVASYGYIHKVHTAGFPETFGHMLYYTHQGAGVFKLVFSAYTDGDRVYRYSDEDPFSSGTLVNVVYTWDGSKTAASIHLYINNVEVSYTNMQDGTGTFVACDGTWSLGGRTYDDLRCLEGELSEVGWWNRVLAAGERKALSQGFSPRMIPRGLKFAPDLIRDQRDIISGEAGTLDGTTVVQHIPIIYPDFNVLGKPVSDQTVITPSTLALELSLHAPLAFSNQLVTPEVLALNLSLLTSTVFSGTLITPSTLTLELSLHTPSILLDFDAAVTPSTLALELSLHAPSISMTASVLPATLILELSLHAPVIGGAPEIIEVSTLALELILRNPNVGAFFPTLSCSPKIESFIDEFSDETVRRESVISGWPLLNPQFTFDPKNYLFILRNVSEADKILLMQFYKSNKESGIFWLNEQDNQIYFVFFKNKPSCELDGNKNIWKMEIAFKQIMML